MKAVIDRIEGELAVVLFGEEETEAVLPLGLLPEGVQEGDWLTVKFEKDPQARKAQEKKVSKLLDRLKKKQ